MLLLSTPQALVLGWLQGLTEFLPVSSSGHLALGAWFFQLRSGSLDLAIALHAGTLVATLFVFRKDLAGFVASGIDGLKNRDHSATTRSALTWMLAIVLASIPTACIGLWLEPIAEHWTGSVPAVAAGFALSACAAWSTRWPQKSPRSIGWQLALVIGVVQGLAVLPGVSRSGSTIACAMLLGIRGPEAFRFSFLLSIPAVAGAILIQSLKPGALMWSLPTLAGAICACFTGYIALRWLSALVSRGQFWWFALYLAPLSAGLFLSLLVDPK